jgi:PAS domain containing serine/threonine kinase
MFTGEAIHQDGNVIDVLYTISNQVLPCGRKVYCVWINRDPDSEYNKQRDEEDDDDDDDKHPNNLTLTFNSITSTVDNSLGQVIKTAASSTTVGAQFSRPHSVSLVSQCEDDQISGNFTKYYTTLKQIGKGAYGYVKMAYRNTDRLLVIAKFILKEKLRPNFIIKTDDDFDVPMEIYLLTKVEHPNIVDILDVYENDKFYQMVSFCGLSFLLFSE